MHDAYIGDALLLRSRFASAPRFSSSRTDVMAVLTGYVQTGRAVDIRLIYVDAALGQQPPTLYMVIEACDPQRKFSILIHTRNIGTVLEQPHNNLSVSATGYEDERSVTVLVRTRDVRRAHFETALSRREFAFVARRQQRALRHDADAD